jgi:hypothetical protein
MEGLLKRRSHAADETGRKGDHITEAWTWNAQAPCTSSHQGYAPLPNPNDMQVHLQSQSQDQHVKKSCISEKTKSKKLWVYHDQQHPNKRDQAEYFLRAFQVLQPLGLRSGRGLFEGNEKYHCRSEKDDELCLHGLMQNISDSEGLARLLRGGSAGSSRRDGPELFAGCKVRRRWVCHSIGMELTRTLVVPAAGTGSCTPGPVVVRMRKSGGVAERRAWTA